MIISIPINTIIYGKLIKILKRYLNNNLDYIR